MFPPSENYTRVKTIRATTKMSFAFADDKKFSFSVPLRVSSSSFLLLMTVKIRRVFPLFIIIVRVDGGGGGEASVAGAKNQREF